MKRVLLLFLTPLILTAQRPVLERNRAEPAFEFTTTQNATQLGKSFVVGVDFTVKSPVILTELGAVLEGGGAQPIFGSLPKTVQVGLWDQSQNLLVSATVSGSDPLIGHFNYTPVPGVQLLPGVTYTIGALVPAGQSVLSDVPGMVSGSVVSYGKPHSLASPTLVFPDGDQIGIRGNYFGAGFLFQGGTAVVAIAGADQVVTAGSEVSLDGSDSFSENGSLVGRNWTLVSKPEGSAAMITGSASETAVLVTDRPGEYVVRLVVSDARGESQPSTVTIEARKETVRTR